MTRDLAGCSECHLIVRLPSNAATARTHCPRCDARVRKRRVDSLARAWALLIAAAILYIPANIYPVMTIISLGRGEPDTIMSGVVYLFTHGMWPLGLVVFVASVGVPILKISALGYLLTSVHHRSTKAPKFRTRLYRVVESVGRWSMVDVYVVTILVALVNLGNLASVEAGVGAIFFGTVVVLTMLAAESFDPRLIWDRAGLNDAERI